MWGPGAIIRPRPWGFTLPLSLTHHFPLHPLNPFSFRIYILYLIFIRFLLFIRPILYPIRPFLIRSTLGPSYYSAFPFFTRPIFQPSYYSLVPLFTRPIIHPSYLAVLNLSYQAFNLFPINISILLILLICNHFIFSLFIEHILR